MPDRRTVAWLAGVVGVALLALAAGLACSLISASLQQQINDFYGSYTGEELAEEVYRYWDRMSQTSFLVGQVAAPLLTASVVGVIAVLGVLARRWDVDRPGAGSAD